MSDGQNGGDTGAAAGAGGDGAATAAALLGGAAAGADGASNAGAGETGASGGEDAGGGEGVGDAAALDFLQNFSADPGEGNEPSMRDWVQSRGYKSFDDLAKSARDNQVALRESGRIKIPGEGASGEEIAAYRKALGVPDDAKGYEPPKLIDSEGKPLIGSDGNPVEIDDERFAAIAGLAHEAGIPKAAFEAVMAKLGALDLQMAAEAERDIQRRAAAHAKKWGGEAAEKSAAVTRAIEALNLTRAEALAIRQAITPERALDVFAKLGAGISEDTMVNGGGRQRFGLSGAEAQKQLTQRMGEKGWTDRAMVPGSAENAEYERLNNAIAAEADRKMREAA